MALSDLAGGVNQSIQQQLARRLQQQQVDRQIAQQAFANQMAEKEFASNEEMKGANLARLQASDDADAYKQQADVAGMLGDRLPAGMEMAESDPAVGMMRAGGAGGMLRTRGIDAPAPPSMLQAAGDSGQAEELPGTMPASPMPGAPRMVIKSASAAQQNTETDNERQRLAGEAAERQRGEVNARADDAARLTAEHRAAVLAKPNASQVVGPGGLPPRLQTQVQSIARGFDSQPVVKRTQLMASAVNFANSMDPNTKNPADDQALLYAFAKAMDPESVVREGEYATIQKYSQSWVESFGFNARRTIDNSEFLTPEARANMKTTITKKFAAEKGQYDNLRRSYVNKINKTSGQDDGEDYLIDYTADAGGAAAPNQAGPAGVAPSGVRKYNPATGRVE